MEQTSIDEGYFDLTCTRRPPSEIALKVKDAITQRLKITVSEGVGSNKLVSAIASKITKPRGFKEVFPGAEKDFLFPLPNNWLPGIGPKTSARLNAAGLALIRQIAGTPVEMLELLLGGQASLIRQYAHGIDDRLLIPAREPQKTFSHQETFGADVTDEEYVEAVLRRMADNLFAKVREDHRSIRTLTVKVRYNDMAEDQCSESLYEPTDLETDIYGKLHGLLRRAWRRWVSLRLVSLKLSNIYDGRFRTELPLEVSAQRQEARARLATVIDHLRHQHGNAVILRGHDFRLRNEPREILAEESTRPKLEAKRKPRAATEVYVPLRCHSYYSFLESTLSPKDVVLRAKQHNLPAVALTDTGNLHGVVEFVQAAQEHDVKPIVGAELRIGDQPLLLYAINSAGYENLCRILSRHAQDAENEASVAGKQRQSVKVSVVQEHNDGLLAVGLDESLRSTFGGRFFQAVVNREGAVACPPVHYARPDDRRRYDILQSIRTLTLLEHTHPEKRQGKHYHFRTPAEMTGLCGQHSEWIRATREIADRCEFSFPFGKPQFPPFAAPNGATSHEFLHHLVLEGLNRRYRGKRIVSDTGAAVPYERVLSQVREELEIICAVGYEDYFLITWDLLQTCRTRGIEWITRGSAADSLVCYCLDISNVCPIRFGLYFRRFLNKERMVLHKLPDIDIDFAHDRKDHVVKMLFEKYGPEHCAVVGGFSTFQARSAFADVAKVLGLSEHQVRRFTEHFPWSFGGSWEPNGFETPRLIESLRSRPECRDLPLDEEPYKTAVQTAAFLDGFPRHPKMHPCGVVLSRVPMHSLTPTFMANKGYTTTHLDMDAVEAVGLVKMDILAQGGLAAMRDAKESLAGRNVQVNLESLEPWADEAVWEMIASGGGRAVHHIESPAMTSLCQMTNVREIDGLIAIVSIIRPGAANEDKKVRFTRRYQKMEPPTFPDPSLEDCLRSTFGLVVYEEHILQICESFAGMNPGRADVLRRALVKQNWKVVEEIAQEFDSAARARGHSDEKIKEVWELVTGFNGYAFCKAHSTAYGVEAYQAAWLKKYYPAEFMAGVLTNGKGFYHPLVYVLECHQLGLKLLPPSVNEPGPAFTVHGNGIRVPVTNVKGLTSRTIQRLVAARSDKQFVCLADFFSRVAPTIEELESIIRVGAFDEFGETRTRQFWQAQHLLRTYGALQSKQGWLVPPPGLEHLPAVPLNEPTKRERLEAETDLFGYAVSGHPLELFDNIAWDSYCPVARLNQFIGQTVTTCGLIIEQRTHHQVTGEPMKFLSISDWTGIVQTELFAPTYRSYGLATVRYPVLEIEARVEPYENGRGFSLRVIRAGKPRTTL